MDSGFLLDGHNLHLKCKLFFLLEYKCEDFFKIRPWIGWHFCIQSPLFSKLLSELQESSDHFHFHSID